MLLAACGGTSDIDIGGGGGGGGGGNPVPENPTIDPGDLPVDGTETCGAFVCSGDVSNITFSAGLLANDPSDDSLILTGGAFADRFGLARVFGLGIAVFITTSLICAIASSTVPGIEMRRNMEMALSSGPSGG